MNRVYKCNVRDGYEYNGNGELISYYSCEIQHIMRMHDNEFHSNFKSVLVSIVTSISWAMENILLMWLMPLKVLICKQSLLWDKLQQ